MINFLDAHMTRWEDLVDWADTGTNGHMGIPQPMPEVCAYIDDPLTLGWYLGAWAGDGASEYAWNIVRWMATRGAAPEVFTDEGGMQLRVSAKEPTDPDLDWSAVCDHTGFSRSHRWTPEMYEELKDDNYWMPLIRRKDKSDAAARKELQKLSRLWNG